MASSKTKGVCVSCPDTIEGDLLYPCSVCKHQCHEKCALPFPAPLGARRTCLPCMFERAESQNEAHAADDDEPSSHHQASSNAEIMYAKSKEAFRISVCSGFDLFLGACGVQIGQGGSLGEEEVFEVSVKLLAGYGLIKSILGGKPSICLN